MKNLILKRLALLPITLLCILSVNFLLIEYSKRGSVPRSHEVAQGASESHYFFHETSSGSLKEYLHQIAHFDFGKPMGNPYSTVVKEVWKHFKVSAMLLWPPLLTVFILSPIIGLFMGYKKGHSIEKALSALFILLYACPLYLAIPLLIEKIGIPYELPSLSGIDGEYLPLVQKMSLYIRGLFLPYLALTYGSLALYSRFSKTLFLHVLNEPYILSAKAKGISNRAILFVHVLRGGMVSLVPLFLGSIGTFLSGLVIVETLFEIKGFGYLFYQALTLRDTHLLLFSTLFASALSLIGYLLADLSLILLDPRIRQDGKVALYY